VFIMATVVFSSFLITLYFSKFEIFSDVLVEIICSGIHRLVEWYMHMVADVSMALFASLFRVAHHWSDISHENLKTYNKNFRKMYRIFNFIYRFEFLNRNFDFIKCLLRK
jgi:hypothetical protein